MSLGFGSCLVKGNTVIGWGSADCCSEDECEIGMLIEPEYRKRGLGTVTTATTVEIAFNEGFKKIGWHAEKHSVGSIGIVENVGFRLERNYNAYVSIFDEEEHLAEIAIRQNWKQSS